MSASHDAQAENLPAVPVTLYSVPGVGQQARVRILGPGHGLLTHYVPKRPTVCKGDGHCDPKLHRSRPQWRGYYAALVAVRLPQPHWQVRVLEITERLGEVWWGEDLTGQEWLLERISEGKYEVMVGHFVRALDPAHLPKACLLDPVLQRVYRLDKVPSSTSPKLKAREFREGIRPNDPFAAAPPAVVATAEDAARAVPPPIAAAAEEAARASKPFGGDTRLAGLYTPLSPPAAPHARRNGRSS